MIHIGSCFCDRVSFAIPKNRNFSTLKLLEFPASHEKRPAAEFVILRQVHTVCQKTIWLSITEGKKVCKGTVRVPFRVQSPAAATKIAK